MILTAQNSYREDVRNTMDHQDRLNLPHFTVVQIVLTYGVLISTVSHIHYNGDIARAFILGE